MLSVLQVPSVNTSLVEMKRTEEGRRMREATEKNQREIESKLQIFNTLFAASELFGIRSWLLRAVVGFESKFLKPPSQLNQWVIQVEVAFRKFSQPFCFIFFSPAGNITLKSQ